MISPKICDRRDRGGGGGGHTFRGINIKKKKYNFGEL